jgi:hypothetical protein
MAALVAGTAALLFLTGCAGDMPHRGGWVAAPQNKRVEQAFAMTPVPRPVTVIVPVRVLIASPAKPKTLQSTSRAQKKRQP